MILGPQGKELSRRPLGQALRLPQGKPTQDTQPNYYPSVHKTLLSAADGPPLAREVMVRIPILLRRMAEGHIGKVELAGAARGRVGPVARLDT